MKVLHATTVVKRLSKNIPWYVNNNASIPSEYLDYYSSNRVVSDDELSYTQTEIWTDMSKFIECNNHMIQYHLDKVRYYVTNNISNDFTLEIKEI